MPMSFFRRPSPSQCVVLLGLSLMISAINAQTSVNEGWQDQLLTTPKFRTGKSLSSEETSSNALADVQAAESLYQQGRNTQALDAFSALVKRFPRNAFFWFRLGNILTRENDPKSAVNAYENAISLDPTDGRFHFNLGILQTSMARASFETAAKLLQADQSTKQEAQRLHEALLAVQDGTALTCNQTPAPPAPAVDVQRPQGTAAQASHSPASAPSAVTGAADSSKDPRP